jgi:hypothetical protein
MTPIVKLVFGADYDKARLTEFAAALAHAERCEVDFEGFLPFIERFPGGLKGLVAAERDARRPEPRSDNRADKARVMLRARPPRSRSARLPATTNSPWCWSAAMPPARSSRCAPFRT